MLRVGWRLAGLWVVLVSVGWTPAWSASDETRLEGQVRLETLLAHALASNPWLRADVGLAGAAQERAAATGRLPEPELKLESWAIPLRAPLAFDRAFMHMVGLRQTFPAFGSLDAQQSAAREEEGQAADQVDMRKEDLVLEVRRAFATYKRLDKEYHLRLEHMGLASRLLETMATAYRAGGGSIPDQLRLKVEMARISGDIARAEQERRAAAATLNTLMNRDPDAELGPAFDRDPVIDEPVVDAFDQDAERDRPEVRSAMKEVRKNEYRLDAAQRQATWPTFMVGLDYMNMPMEQEHHGYGAMISVNLPWLNPARSANVRAGEQSRQSAIRFSEAARSQARLEIRASLARWRAARERLILADQSLIPLARQSFELVQSQYAAGRGDISSVLDSFRGYLDGRLERVRAVADIEIATAERDRAAGGGRAFVATVVGHH